MREATIAESARVLLIADRLNKCLDCEPGADAVSALALVVAQAAFFQKMPESTYEEALAVIFAAARTNLDSLISGQLDFGPNGS